MQEGINFLWTNKTFLRSKKRNNQIASCLQYLHYLGSGPKGDDVVEYRGKSVRPSIPPIQATNHCGTTLDKWTARQIERRMDVRTDSPCTQQNVVHFKSAALPTSKLPLQYWWAGQGYRWPYISHRLCQINLWALRARAQGLAPQGASRLPCTEN